MKQQGEALSYCQKIFPEPTKFEPLKEVVDTVKKILIDEDLLSKAIIDIKLEPYKNTDNVETNQQKFNYYKEVLDWLNYFNVEKFSDTEKSSANFVVNEMNAKAHYFLGMLYENNADLTDKIKVNIPKYLGISYQNNDWLTGNGEKLYCFLAIREYVEALKIELKEYFESTESEKDYSFVYTYGDYKTSFSDTCSKIGNLLLKLGKCYDSENQSKSAISLIQKAIQYFMIGVNIRYIEECDKVLTGILEKQPKDMKDKFQKELCESLGDFFLKLGFLSQAKYKFQEALSLAKLSDEQVELEVKIDEINSNSIKLNASFFKAIGEKGKIEDLSIFKNKATGKQFLVEIKKILYGIIKPPQELQYKDPYDEIEPPQSPPVPLPASQLQAPEPEANLANVGPLDPNVVLVGEN